MRSLISRTVAVSRPDAAAWYPGLPHALAALATGPILGVSAAIAGILMASLVTFVVWLPLTALALNNGQALSPADEAPALTPFAKRVLFVAWTLTAWLAAAITR